MAYIFYTNGKRKGQIVIFSKMDDWKESTYLKIKYSSDRL